MGKLKKVLILLCILALPISLYFGIETVIRFYVMIDLHTSLDRGSILVNLERLKRIDPETQYSISQLGGYTYIDIASSHVNESLKLRLDRDTQINEIFSNASDLNELEQLLEFNSYSYELTKLKDDTTVVSVIDGKDTVKKIFKVRK